MPNEVLLMRLRDRIGLLDPRKAQEAMQRLTWLGIDPVLLNQAIDDAENPLH